MNGNMLLEFFLVNKQDPSKTSQSKKIKRFTVHILEFTFVKKLLFIHVCFTWIANQNLKNLAVENF